MKRIAIIEDEPMMREELAQIMRKAGYDVYTVSSFSDAAEQVTGSCPDLVVLDINPVPSGRVS